jgi:hypothetical protein
VIIKSVVTALQGETVVGRYTYLRPVDEIDRDCLRLWMEWMEFLHPGCTFQAVNYKDGVGETFSLGPPPKGDLF